MEDDKIEWRHGKPNYSLVNQKYLKDWGSIEKTDYKFVVNGGEPLSAEDNLVMGNYNMLLKDSVLFDSTAETHDSSHDLFRTAFPDGFAWEVLEVFSGPPKVSFTWRHWTNWTGPYKNIQPTGERIEMIGSCIATVTKDLKIQEIQVFYDPNMVLAKLTKHEKNVSACPIGRA